MSIKDFGILSLSELPETDPNSDLVERLLTEGGSSILAGKVKKGKSTLARNLAICVAKGIPFLGRKVKQGPVLYFALEENIFKLKEIFSSMKALDTNDLHIVPKNHKMKGIQDLRTAILELNPVLVIIDTLYRFISIKDSNSYTEVTERLAPYIDLASESKCHIMFVHHTGKSNEERGSGSERVIGSTALVGTVDTILMFHANGDKRSLSGEVRYGRLDPLTLNFDPQTNIYSDGLSIADDTVEEKVKRVVEGLRDYQGPLTRQELREKRIIEAGNDVLIKICERLRSHPKIEVLGTGKPHDKFQYQYKDPKNTSSIEDSRSYPLKDSEQGTTSAVFRE